MFIKENLENTESWTINSFPDHPITQRWTCGCFHVFPCFSTFVKICTWISEREACLREGLPQRNISYLSLSYNNVRNTFTTRLYPDIIVIEHTSFPHFFPDSLVLPVESSMIYLGENSPQVSCDKLALMLVGSCTSHWARSFIPWQIIPDYFNLNVTLDHLEYISKQSFKQRGTTGIVLELSHNNFSPSQVHNWKEGNKIVWS